MSIKPRTKVPALSLPLVGGGQFELAQSAPKAFTLLVVYRGLHCPICKTYLRDLDRKLAEFEALGVKAVAASTDTQERAEQSRTEWGIEHLSIAYGLGVEQARAWGLFISASIKDGEPPLFAEPGLFLIRPDQTLYAASIQTMPFARPSFADLLAAVKMVTEKNYPARGEA
ncbi:MAG: peroxiredoxin-like family protein [Acetobacteraceae bacterium]